MTFNKADRHEFSMGYISLMPEGYLFVEMKDGSVSTIETIKESQKIIHELLPEGDICIVVNSGVGSTSENEIYDYIKSDNFKKRIKAQAIIVNDLATRLMGTIFLKFIKHQRDVKLFTKHSDAVKWILEKMQDSKDKQNSSSGKKSFVY